MRFMAYFNLLAGNCIGTLGATYSARSKSGNVLKARPFSKSPSSTTQKNCVRAFEALNRISSKLAKTSWNLFNLSDAKTLKHNAIATFLKPCIQNHAFEPRHPVNRSAAASPPGQRVRSLPTNQGQTSFHSESGSYHLPP